MLTHSGNGRWISRAIGALLLVGLASYGGGVTWAQSPDNKGIEFIVTFLPNAPGKEILHPVAVVIFGGLVSATFLDSLLTPLLFLRFGRSSLERLVSQSRAGRMVESY